MEIHLFNHRHTHFTPAAGMFTSVTGVTAENSVEEVCKLFSDISSETNESLHNPAHSVYQSFTMTGEAHKNMLNHVDS